MALFCCMFSKIPEANKSLTNLWRCPSLCHRSLPGGWIPLSQGWSCPLEQRGSFEGRCINRGPSAGNIKFSCESNLACWKLFRLVQWFSQMDEESPSSWCVSLTERQYSTIVAQPFAVDCLNTNQLRMNLLGIQSSFSWPWASKQEGCLSQLLGQWPASTILPFSRLPQPHPWNLGPHGLTWSGLRDWKQCWGGLGVRYRADAVLCGAHGIPCWRQRPPEQVSNNVQIFWCAWRPFYW